MKRIQAVGKIYLDATGNRVWETRAAGTHVILHDTALPIGR